ncbi:MAG: L-histidine N(alpha)-methyltransferase [Okeania sp. SIO3C4]|nr:L-histidine N(alpha)-methyltransferase [Okeania sp. SIO3C4]
MENIEAEKLRQQLADEVENLWIPSPKLKYYEAGSELLEVILSDEKYYLARKEQELIDLHYKSIMDFGDYSSKHTIVDLGSSSGKKTLPFLKEALQRFEGVYYVPIDTAQSAIDLCHKNVEKEFPGLPVISYTDSWEICMKNDFYNRFRDTNITVFLLGSTIGNFSESDSLAFISKFMNIFSSMENSRLVIMFDSAPSEHKPVKVIEDAYNSEAMENIDWHMIKMIDKYLEIDIPLDKLKRCSEFDYSEKALVRWMELTEDCTISYTPENKKLKLLRKGTRIQTEISRKYSQEDIFMIQKNAKTKIWMTPDYYYMCAAFQP